jgi:P27 family predicted phage terminase small subunit
MEEAMRGRRPTPTYLKLLRGNPGQRRLNMDEPQPAQPPAPPEPPEYLNGYGAQEWRRVIAEAHRLRLVTSLDVHVLGAYCESYKRWRTALERIEAIAKTDTIMAGLLIKTQSGGAAANPLVWIAAAAARDMLRFAGELGLTAVARSRIKAVAAGGPGKFDGLLA